MNNPAQDSTVAPPIVGHYQLVKTISHSTASGTNAPLPRLRVVSTTATEGEIILRYSPLEPSERQNTNS